MILKENSALSVDAVLADLKVFLEENGFAVERYQEVAEAVGYELIVSKNSVLYCFRSFDDTNPYYTSSSSFYGLSGIAMTCATSYDAEQSWNYQSGKADREVVMFLSSACDYTFAFNEQTNQVFLYAKSFADVFTGMCFGEVGTSSIPFFTATSRLQSGYGGTVEEIIDNQTYPFFDSTNTCIYYANSWITGDYAVSTTTSKSVPNYLYSKVNSVYSRSASVETGVSALMPNDVYVYDSEYSIYRYAGSIEGLYLVNMRDLDVESEKMFGSKTYRMIPFFSKPSPVVLGGRRNMAGFAIEVA
ncbi:TPA: hypothetical protein ACQYFB_004596 [Vibrio parahaemolyticus]